MTPAPAARAAPPPKEVAAVFARHPEAVRRALLEARALIFEAAEETGVGPLTETLKWGEPAYLTEATKAGSTVRLGLVGGRAAVLFNCRTSLLDGFRADFPELECSGDRALILTDAAAAVMPICLARALTYHRAKREGRRP